MLLPFAVTTWDTNQEKYLEKIEGFNPELVAHVEEGEEGIVLVWMDGADKPHKVHGAVEELLSLINAYCGYQQTPDEPAEVTANG